MAVAKAGYVDNVRIKVYVCFESECRVGLEMVTGTRFVVRVEDWGDGLI